MCTYDGLGHAVDRRMVFQAWEELTATPANDPSNDSGTAPAPVSTPVNNDPETAPAPVSTPDNLPVNAPVSFPRDDEIDIDDGGEGSNNIREEIIRDDKEGISLPATPPGEGANSDEATEGNGSSKDVAVPDREIVSQTPSETQPAEDSSSNVQSVSVFITVASTLMSQLYSN